MATMTVNQGAIEQNELLDPLGLDLSNCLQEQEPIDDELLQQLCSSEDIWNGVQFPDLNLPDEILGIGSFPPTHHTNSNLTNQFDEFPGLTTPPESPPDAIMNTSSSLVPQTDHTPHSFIDSSLLTNLSPPSSAINFSPEVLSTPPPATAPTLTPVSTPAPTPAPTLNPNPAPTPASPLLGSSLNQQVNNTGSIVTANGGLVQVLKSGEVVPINALLTSINSPNQVKQEVVGQKRPHPSSTVSSQPEVKLSKRQQRLIKNRESASLSRQKKKEYVNTLEAKLKEAALKNVALLKENEKLKEQINKLETENDSLRHQQPGSHALKPAGIVFVVVLCFTVVLFPLKSHLTSSPSPVTSLSVPLNPSGRALLSVEDSLSISRREYLSYQRIRRMLESGSHRNSDTVCTCPVTHNVTRASILNSELSVSFNREEMLLMNLLEEAQTNKDLSQKIENSLMVVNGLEQSHRQLYDNEDCYCHRGIFKFYKSLKKSMSRDLGNYYLVSFKDHLLLNAPLRNSSSNPMLSVIIPAHNGTYHSPPGSMAMLQLDCEVMDSNVFHMEMPN